MKKAAMIKGLFAAIADSKVKSNSDEKTTTYPMLPMWE